MCSNRAPAPLNSTTFQGLEPKIFRMRTSRFAKFELSRLLVVVVVVHHSTSRGAWRVTDYM